MRRTKVTLAAKRNRARDESVEPRLSCQAKGEGKRKKDAHLNSLRPMVIAEGGSGKGQGWRYRKSY